MAQKFMDDIISGERPANEYIKKAVQRHFADLDNLSDQFYFDKNEASRIEKIIGLMKHSGGIYRGKEFQLLEWQSFVINMLFGWRRKSDDTRRFTKSYIEIPKKNGKSEFAGAIGLLGAFFSGLGGVEVYSAANKLDQAAICWNAAKEMAKFLHQDFPDDFNPTIHDSFNNRRMFDSDANNFFRPISSDSKTLDGIRPYFAIIDEFHEAKTDAILRNIESGSVMWPDPLLFIITTAGFNRFGPCYHLRNVLTDILEGHKDDDSFFGLIFTPDEDDDWEDEKTWEKVNPSIGITPTWRGLREQYTKAKNEGETARINFLTKNLNIWTTARKVWIKPEVWNQNQQKIDVNELVGLPCYGGLDIASTKDITAFCLFFRAVMTARWKMWIPEETVRERTERDGVKYMQWVKDGLLHTTPGNVTDTMQLFEDISEMCGNYDVKMISYDRWRSIDLVNFLTQEGVNMHPYGMGFQSQSAPLQRIEMWATNGQLNHGGHPVIDWMIQNVELQHGANGHIRADKDKASEKIDGVIALTLAVGGWLVDNKGAPPIKSIYEERGMIST
jgi:phage terminase large subunit-like protein